MGNRSNDIFKAIPKTAADKKSTQSRRVTFNIDTMMYESKSNEATTAICPTSNPTLKPKRLQPICWSSAIIKRIELAKPIPWIRPKASAKK